MLQQNGISSGYRDAGATMIFIMAAFGGRPDCHDDSPVLRGAEGMILPNICLFRSKNRFILCRVRERGQSVRQVPFVGWTDGGNPFMGENIGNGTSFAWTAGDGMNGRRNAEECNAALREKMLYLLPEAARLESVLPGLTLIRHDGERKAMKCFYHPMAALIVQGVKRSVIGKREVCYGEGQCMVIGVDMPGVFHIMEASAQKPFLSLAVSLDRHVITRIMEEMPSLAEMRETTAAPISVAEAGADLLDAFIRLVDLLDTPSRIPLLAPLILREIHFLLLEGSPGACLRLFHSGATQAGRIARAVSRLREKYAEPLHIEELARQANMAPSTFHRHFRQVTGMSPLQFQKRLRLYEAERLMLVDGLDAGVAALKVGYESGSQFSREYRRQFGEPPRRDVTRKIQRS